MSELYFKRMLEILERAGIMAMEMIEDCAPELKADRSVVTRADKAISVFVRDSLKDYLDSGDHILIDEEDAENGRFMTDALLDAQPYIWSLDPIDGTRPYANGLPYFGVSLGLLKNRSPWIGGVLFPMLDELFYSDGDRAYFVKYPFTSKAQTKLILPIDRDIDDVSIFYCSDSFFKHFYWESRDCHMIIPSCAVADLCWPVIGRGCGCLFQAHLWDFVGAWSVFRHAGMDLRSLATGEIMNKLDLAHYQVDRSLWRLRDFYILSTEKHFSLLQSHLVLRSGEKLI